MKALLLSDIHSNIHALEAIYAKERDCDLIYCAGDLVDWGPYPCEVLSWVREYRVTCVRGNHDELVATSYRSRDSRPTGEVTSWCDHNASLLAAADIHFLESLPPALPVDIEGVLYGLTHLYRDYEEIVSLHAFDEFAARMFPDQAVPHRLILGHTHRQAVRLLCEDRLWINPGSASYRRPDDPDQSAHYAVITDGNPSLRRVCYDARPVYEAAMRLGFTVPGMASPPAGNASKKASSLS